MIGTSASASTVVDQLPLGSALATDAMQRRDAKWMSSRVTEFPLAWWRPPDPVALDITTADLELLGSLTDSASLYGPISWSIHGRRGLIRNASSKSIAPTKNGVKHIVRS
jgi:hypothetical protein